MRRPGFICHLLADTWHLTRARRRHSPALFFFCFVLFSCLKTLHRGNWRRVNWDQGVSSAGSTALRSCWARRCRAPRPRSPARGSHPPSRPLCAHTPASVCHPPPPCTCLPPPRSLAAAGDQTPKIRAGVWNNGVPARQDYFTSKRRPWTKGNPPSRSSGPQHPPRLEFLTIVCSWNRGLKWKTTSGPLMKSTWNLRYRKKGSKRPTVLPQSDLANPIWALQQPERSNSSWHVRLETFWATGASGSQTTAEPGTWKQKESTVPVPVPAGNRLPDYRD